MSAEQLANPVDKGGEEFLRHAAATMRVRQYIPPGKWAMQYSGVLILLFPQWRGCRSQSPPRNARPEASARKWAARIALARPSGRVVFFRSLPDPGGRSGRCARPVRAGSFAACPLCSTTDQKKCINHIKMQKSRLISPRRGCQNALNVIKCLQY